MRTWPHSGFPVQTAVWVSEDDRAFATRLARYGARHPVALERRSSDRRAKAVTYRSDTSDGPTAGPETGDPLECLARVLVHSPDKGQVTTRYDGWSANRPRGMRGTAATAASRRWAALLPQIFEVDPLACPTCRGPMRIACITQASVIDQILAPLRARAATAAHADARRRAGRRAPAGRRGVGDRAVCSPYVRRILDRARLNFLSCIWPAPLTTNP